MFWLIRVLMGRRASQWLIDSLADTKGQASARRLSALYLMVLYGIGHLSYIWIMHSSDDAVKIELAEYLAYLMGIDVVGALLFMGLVTVQNIQTGLETIRNKKPSTSETSSENLQS